MGQGGYLIHEPFSAASFTDITERYLEHGSVGCFYMNRLLDTYPRVERTQPKVTGLLIASRGVVELKRFGCEGTIGAKLNP